MTLIKASLCCKSCSLRLLTCCNCQANYPKKHQAVLCNCQLLHHLGSLRLQDRKLLEGDLRVSAQTKELNNGRLAMIAIAAFVVQVRKLLLAQTCQS